MDQRNPTFEGPANIRNDGAFTVGKCPNGSSWHFSGPGTISDFSPRCAPKRTSVKRCLSI